MHGQSRMRHSCRWLHASTAVQRLPKQRSALQWRSSASFARAKVQQDSSPTASTSSHSQTARIESTRRRFWKTVSIKTLQSGDYHVTLDGKPLKTPAKSVLCIPKSKLATAALIAREWDEQETILLSSSLPMTSLASRAIDGLSTLQDRQCLINNLMKFLDTDTIIFHQSSPSVLVQLQHQHWIPLLNWVKENFQVDFTLRLHDYLSKSCQSEVTKSTLFNVIKSYDQWTLAAFERAVYATKSFIISLALIEGRISVEQAAHASRVEVLSQIARWGEVEDTHDVDHHDIRSRLGSVACLLTNTINIKP